MKRSRPPHRPCTICDSPNRGLIEKSHVAGLGAEAIASRYGVSRHALYRHCKKHVTDEARKAYASQDGLTQLAKTAAEDGLSVLDRLRIVNGYLTNEVQRSADRGESVATPARALFEGLRDQARLTGETLEAVGNISLVQNNFYQSPDYLQLQSVLVQCLSPYPEAMRAVLAGLEELEGGQPVTTRTDEPKLIEGRVIDHD